MIRRRTPRKPSSAKVTTAFSEVIEWVLSLPWVVERPADKRFPAIRLFAVECPPLERSRIFLLTGGAKQAPDGRTYGTDLAAVMPVEAGGEAAASGWEVHRATPSSAHHVLTTLAPDASRERDDIEAFVLAAYSNAMA